MQPTHSFDAMKGSDADQASAQEPLDDAPARFREELPPDEKSAAPALGATSVHGAFWTIVSIFMIKLISLLSQIVVAWFLFPADMGLVAFALSITSIVELMSCAGITVVMIQRQTEFEKDSADVFWLSLTMYCVGTAVSIGIAPIAAWMMNDSRVMWLIMIIALSWPLMSTATIYYIKLMRDFRFKELANLQTTATAFKAATTIALAATGFGVYSLVLPLFVHQAVIVVLMRRVVGPLPLRNPHPSRWMGLLIPTLMLSLQSLFQAVEQNGTVFIVGTCLQNATIAGIYFWGYMLSEQSMFLLVNGLRRVLFPTLARLNDEPQRQQIAYNNALRMLSLVAVPLCFVQALTADSLIRLVFPARWEGAIPVVQWLSLGMLTQPLEALAHSLLTAHGRFRTIMVLQAWQAITIVCAGAIGAWIGTASAIAMYSSIVLFLNGLLLGWKAERLFGGGWYMLANSLRRLIVPSVVSSGLGWLAGRCVQPYGALAELVTIAVVVLGGYFILMLRFAREDMLELMQRLKLSRMSNYLSPQAP
jgi:O-antigen/teichoic acid export membrane protein